MINNLYIAGKYDQEMIKQEIGFFSKIDQNLINYFSIYSPVERGIILFEVDYFDGNFPTRITIYLQEDTFTLNLIDFSMYLSKKLKDNVLISHWENNPFLWILINPEGNLYQVEEIPLDKECYLMIDTEKRINLDLAYVKEKMGIENS
jgi:hypothetical protein